MEKELDVFDVFISLKDFCRGSDPRQKSLRLPPNTFDVFISLRDFCRGSVKRDQCQKRLVYICDKYAGLDIYLNLKDFCHGRCLSKETSIYEKRSIHMYIWPIHTNRDLFVWHQSHEKRLRYVYEPEWLLPLQMPVERDQYMWKEAYIYETNTHEKRHMRTTPTICTTPIYMKRDLNIYIYESDGLLLWQMSVERDQYMLKKSYVHIWPLHTSRYIYEPEGLLPRLSKGTSICGKRPIWMRPIHTKRDLYV